MVADLFGKVLNFLRLVNNKTFKLKIFTYPGIIRSKLQLILFYLLPTSTHLLSVSYHKLPTKKQRIIKTDNVLDDITIFDNSLRFDEVNIFFRGFGNNFSEVKNKKNIMLVNYSFQKDKSVDTTGDYLERELLISVPRSTHVGSGYEIDECIKKNLPCIILQGHQMENNIPIIARHKSQQLNLTYENYLKKNSQSKIIKYFFNTTCKTIRSGSGLQAALIFSKISKKVNIYGWNFYLEKLEKNLSSFKAYNLLSPLSQSSKGKRESFFEYMLCNLAYIKRLQELEHVKIQGYLKDYSNLHTDITKKALEIFYR